MRALAICTKSTHQTGLYDQYFTILTGMSATSSISAAFALAGTTVLVVARASGRPSLMVISQARASFSLSPTTATRADEGLFAQHEQAAFRSLEDQKGDR